MIKQSALIIDAAEPGTQINLNIGDAIGKAEGVNNPVVIDNERNLVLVKLSEEGGYRYSYFNDAIIVYSIQGNNLVMEVKEDG